MKFLVKMTMYDGAVIEREALNATTEFGALIEVTNTLFFSLGNGVYYYKDAILKAEVTEVPWTT